MFSRQIFLQCRKIHLISFAKSSLRLDAKPISHQRIYYIARYASGGGGHGHHGDHTPKTGDSKEVGHVVSPEDAFSQPKVPVVTYDDLPVPKYPYKEMYDKENKKFNMFLIVAAVAFMGTVIYIYTTDALDLSVALPPKSYRNRHKEIAKYKEEEAKAKVTASGDAEKLAPAGKQALPIVTGKVVDDAKPTAKAPKAQSAAPPPLVVKASESTALPEHVKYLIVGAGTAAFSAYRAIRASDADAKVLVIGEEEFSPYMRPPLSKELWFSDDKNVRQTLRFKQWNGREKSLFYEKDEFYCKPDKLNGLEHGGVALASGRKVTKIDAVKHEAYLENGDKVKYDKCLIATGGRPKNLKEIENAGSEVAQHVSLYRNINDFKKLDEISRKVKTIAIVGGGFLGSELACALGRKVKETGLEVIQIFPEAGNMGRVLPEYLSNWTTEKVKKEGVTVIPSTSVVQASPEGKQVSLQLSSGKTIKVDHVVVAVGLEPNVDLADPSCLEVDKEIGGYRCDAELRTRTDVWVAGDCCSFYDIKLGRRRVEHHDHAVVSGRLAGENMAGAGKPYWHQSMFWSDLGPEVGYEAIGIVDSSLKTIGVFAKASDKDTPKAVVTATGEGLRSETEQAAKLKQPSAQLELPEPNRDYGKGVIFYLRGKKIVGMVMWNLFNRMPVARKILTDDNEYDDFNEVAKLFNLHGSSSGEDAEAS